MASNNNRFLASTGAQRVAICVHKVQTSVSLSSLTTLSQLSDSSLTHSQLSLKSRQSEPKILCLVN